MASTAQNPTGQPIRMAGGKLQVPDTPIIPFIEGDGTGPDIWRASQRVFDAAVEKAYGGKRRIVWKEVLAGEKAFNSENNWLPDATVEAFKTYKVRTQNGVPVETVIGEPAFDNPEAIQLKEDTGLSYSFQVEVQPEFTVPDTKGLKVKKPKRKHNRRQCSRN
jgi:hypothetical protein